MSKIDRSVIPVLYVILMVPILAISMVYFSISSVFKGLITVSSLIGALGLSANISQWEEKGTVQKVAPVILATVLLYALSGLLFLSLLS